MTLPDERTRAIYYTKLFLRDLLDPKKTPKVSKEIRRRAYACLRHYPGLLDLLHPETSLNVKEAERLAREQES